MGDKQNKPNRFKKSTNDKKEMGRNDQAQLKAFEEQREYV